MMFFGKYVYKYFIIQEILRRHGFHSTIKIIFNWFVLYLIYK